MKICYTHLVDITIESEASGHRALAAEGILGKISFKFRSKDTNRFRLSNGIRRAIPDLRASGAKAMGKENRFGNYVKL